MCLLLHLFCRSESTNRRTQNVERILLLASRIEALWKTSRTCRLVNPLRTACSHHRPKLYLGKKEEALVMNFTFMKRYRSHMMVTNNDWHQSINRVDIANLERTLCCGNCQFQDGNWMDEILRSAVLTTLHKELSPWKERKGMVEVTRTALFEYGRLYWDFLLPPSATELANVKPLRKLVLTQLGFTWSQM